jgi:hypothetical protein
LEKSQNIIFDMDENADLSSANILLGLAAGTGGIELVWNI